jgi:hypothetical protein
MGFVLEPFDRTLDRRLAMEVMHHDRLGGQDLRPFRRDTL